MDEDFWGINPFESFLPCRAISAHPGQGCTFGWLWHREYYYWSWFRLRELEWTAIWDTVFTNGRTILGSRIRCSSRPSSVDLFFSFSLLQYALRYSLTCCQYHDLHLVFNLQVNGCIKRRLSLDMYYKLGCPVRSLPLTALLAVVHIIFLLYYYRPRLGKSLHDSHCT